MSENKLKATLEFEGKKAEFEGSFEEVWRSINRFLSELNPTTQLSGLTIKVNLADMLEKMKDIVQIDKDVGPVISPSVNIEKLTREEKIALVLLMRKISYMTGNSESDVMEVTEVEKDCGFKTPGPDISELISKKIVINLSEARKKGLYKISDYGIQWFTSSTIEKIEKK
jgi:hypothetical protein